MKLGIIGTGNMGRAIGVRLAHMGHQVLFGSRSVERAKQAVEMAGETALSGTAEDAARYGDVLFWTVRELDVRRVLKDCSLVDGKIVVDINNRDYQTELQSGSWFAQSIAEAIQLSAPGARVVKALNTIAMETLDTDPDLLRRAGAHTFIAGDDASAKETVNTLLEQLGLTAVDLGEGVVSFRAIEALGDVIRLLIVSKGYGPRANLQLHMLPEPDLSMVGPRVASEYH
jgi:predicted dinucleotide-binding enzyme